MEKAFCESMTASLKAVRSSGGQTGGQVNRLKPLKRQSYGRAGFDLLLRRVLMAA